MTRRLAVRPIDVNSAGDQLRLALEAGHAVGWDWDVKSGRDTWFGDLRTMFGISGNTYVGQVADFRNRVHPDDRELVWKAVSEARDNRSVYRADFRLVWPDGTVRWASACGSFSYSSLGEPVRMLGIAADITTRKRIEDQLRESEEALIGLSHRLMETNETERTAVARELHDDLGQRMALLTIELERLKQSLPGGTANVPVQELCGRALELGQDLQAISHRLHSSKLEFLGVASAAASFCRDLSEQKGVAIDFSHDGIPRDLPKDIALCLFRVLQEALNNGVKHAGVRRFTVALNGGRNQVQLEVVDRGLGFDPEAAMGNHGLGLLAMRERLHAVKGQISIESRPGGGTKVCARVPLSAGIM